LQSSHEDKYLVSFLQGRVGGALNKANSLWESRILVFASSPKEALSKVFDEFGGTPTSDPDALPSTFEGFTSIVPIHEELADLSEIEWIDHTRSINSNLKDFVAGRTVADAMIRFDLVTEEESCGLPSRTLVSWSKSNYNSEQADADKPDPAAS